LFSKTFELYRVQKIPYSILESSLKTRQNITIIESKFFCKKFKDFVLVLAPTYLGSLGNAKTNRIVSI
jgi:hypothetical protein